MSSIESETKDLPLEAYWWAKLSPEAVSELLTAMYRIGCYHGENEYISTLLEYLPWMHPDLLIKTINQFGKRKRGEK